MKNYKIKTSFVSPEGSKARVYKTGINFRIFILIFVENCLKFDAIHDFSVRLRTGSNPVDCNRFQSHTGKRKLHFLEHTEFFFCYFHPKKWECYEVKFHECIQTNYLETTAIELEHTNIKKAFRRNINPWTR